MCSAEQPRGDASHEGPAPERGVGDERTRYEDQRNTQTRQEAQVGLVLRTLGEDVGIGPKGWREEGAQFLLRAGHILVRDAYLDRVRGVLAGSEISRTLIEGVTLLRVQEDTLAALARVRDAFGSGVAAPDHLVSICPTGGCCPASEPEVVAAGSAPDPAPTPDRAAGQRIRVVVVDTGLDHDAAATHAWMRGVEGEPDAAIQPPNLLPYAGHGTFIAGIVRCMAPQAEVIVKAAFTDAGAIYESGLVEELDRVLNEDHPDVISMSAGTWTYDPTGLLGFQVFYDTRLRHHKGIVLVAAAGNDSSRRPFWPAAAPWTVSVGSLAQDWRSRAQFSNFGGWVDIYAPGENVINAFPNGTYTYQEPPKVGQTAQFDGMASWSGTSFSTPLVAGLIAARMSRTGENGHDAASALLATARSAAVPGVGAVLAPS
jgi:subtilisin family serine protease